MFERKKLALNTLISFNTYAMEIGVEQPPQRRTAAVASQRIQALYRAEEMSPDSTTPKLITDNTKEEADDDMTVSDNEDSWGFGDTPQEIAARWRMRNDREKAARSRKRKKEDFELWAEALLTTEGVQGVPHYAPDFDDLMQ